MLVERAYILDPDDERGAVLAKQLRRLVSRVERHDHYSEFSQREPDPKGVLLVAHTAASFLLEKLGNAELELPVIVYTEQPRAGEVVHAIESGALDFLEWPICKERLEIALRRAGDNSDPKMTELRKRFSARKSVGLLSPRELAVLSSMMIGRLNKETARELGISPRTVEIHRGNLLRKLNAGGSANAVRVGVYAGLERQVDIPSPECSVERLDSADA